MTRFIQDQGKVVGIFESGTYAVSNGSVFWPGQVMELKIDEQENLIETRYLGGSSRNFMTMEQGPRDYTGTLSYRVQDLRLLGYALGSVVSTSGTTQTHNLKEVDNGVRQSPFTSGTLNPPISFTLEESKTVYGSNKNFIRTLKGVIPMKVTLNLKQNQPVTADVDFVAQDLIYSNGATTAVQPYNNRPYLWADTLLTLGGSVIQTVKDITFELDNGVTNPHYLNGSRVIAVPFRENRNYTMTVILDADSESIQPFYQQFFLGGSSFNATLDLNADLHAGVTGSAHATIFMSGCRLFDMTTAAPNTGVSEQTLVVRPQNVNAVVYDTVTGSGNGYMPF